MCFSATASFGAAAVTLLAGAATVSRARTWRELPLASMPLVFAVQQASEGMIWLDLANPAHDGLAATWTAVFSYLALGFWPVLVPLAALLIENGRWRRLVMAGLLTISIPLAWFGLAGAYRHPYTACIVYHSISYIGGARYSLPMLAAYAVCTVVPMLLSSHRMLGIFGAILTVGFFVSSFAFYEAFVSVWCFFAAAASVVLVAHFANARRPALFGDVPVPQATSEAQS